jgi:hypothetical protein
MTASVHPDNCLASTNPELIPEWDKERNAGLKPYDVLASSHKKVWWKCSNGHQWYSDIRYRAQKKEDVPTVHEGNRQMTTIFQCFILNRRLSGIRVNDYRLEGGSFVFSSITN